MTDTLTRDPDLDTLSRAARADAVGRGLIYESGQRGRGRALADEFTLLRHSIGLLLQRAWLDTKARYRRSLLGPYWLTLGTLTFVMGYSVLAGVLFNRPLEDFLGYIACGVITWQLIALNLSEGAKVFVAGGSEIKSIRMSLLSYPVRLLLRSLIGFLHSMPIALLVVLYTDEVNLNTLMVVPGLFLLCLGLLPAVTLLGTLAARFRDIEQATGMIIQFAFYMTPLLWKVELLGDGMGRWIALGNPFYYAVTIVRAPLLGEPVLPEVWIGAIALVVVMNLLGLVVFARFRQRLPFWI